MTKPITDWRDAYEAIRCAASIAEDTLDTEKVTQMRALIERAEESVHKGMGAAGRLSLRGGSIIQDRRRIYEQAVLNIAEGPARDAALLLDQGDMRNHIKSTDEVKGCAGLLTVLFNVPHHAVIEDIHEAYREQFGDDD